MRPSSTPSSRQAAPSYVYVYDEFIQDRRYEKEVLKIENRLTDLGLAGKIARIGLFKRADDLIREEVQRGLKTVVVVGNDATVRKVLDVVADEGVVFGIIPLGPDNTLAQLLGIPEGVAACDVLSARIVETIDCGVVNGKRFVSGLSIATADAEITCEGHYRVTPQGKGSIDVMNLSSASLTDPRDGRLETVIRSTHRTGRWLFGRERQGQTTLPLRSLAIRSVHALVALADGVALESNRFDISVEPMALRVITGKARQF